VIDLYNNIRNRFTRYNVRNRQPANRAAHEEGSSMIKSHCWVFLLPGLIYAVPTFAILLDC